jgi:histidyl-tRNA synthetase
MVEEKGVSADFVLVACASAGAYEYASSVLSTLRIGGVPSDLPVPGRSLAKQLEDAGKVGVSWVAIVGTKELASKTVTLRDMKEGKEEILPLAEAVKRLQGS